MSFTERSDLKLGERAPLIENPIIWTRRYEHPYKNLDFSERAKRKERFQWMVFLGVTAVSLLLLLATVGFVMRNTEAGSSPAPGGTGTPRPLVPLPTIHPAAPGVVLFSTTQGTTTTTPSPPTTVPSVTSSSSLP